SSVSHKFELATGSPEPAQAAAQPTAAPPAPNTAAAVSTDSTAPESPKSSGRALAYVAGGVGLVGIGAGVLFAVMRSSKVKEMEALCTGPSGACPESNHPQLDDLDGSARTNGALSVVGFAIGGVGLAAAATLLMTSPASTPSAMTPRVQPWLGLGSAGVG